MQRCSKDAKPGGVGCYYVGIPKRSWERWFAKKSVKAAFKGFQIVKEPSLRNLKAPFPDCVILTTDGKESSLQLPALGEEYLAMALAPDYAGKRKLEGPKVELSAEISIIQKINDLLLDRKTSSDKIARVTVGKFSVQVQPKSVQRIG